MAACGVDDDISSFDGEETGIGAMTGGGVGTTGGVNIEVDGGAIAAVEDATG